MVMFIGLAKPTEVKPRGHQALGKNSIAVITTPGGKTAAREKHPSSLMGEA
jgi:hypothetical protein